MSSETHRPVLERYVPLSAPLPVLELGAGDGSTELLDALAGDRLVVTVDNDRGWLDRFARLASERHRLVLVERWEDFPYAQRRWGVALVDQAPGSARGPAVEALAEAAEFIVVHDTNEECAHIYPGLADALAAFPNRRTFGAGGIETTVVSRWRAL